MSEIVLVGDTAFTGIISTDPNSNIKRYSELALLLKRKEASLVFANLEVPVKARFARNEFKNIIHYSDSEVTAALLKFLNISCVSLANNHIYDCKMPGLKATINLLDNLGIYHTGAGWTSEQCDPVIIEESDTRIGFIAYVDIRTNPKTESFKELFINYFDYHKVIQDISKLKSRVDKVICSIHWGVDYSYYPTPEQVKIAHDLIDSGADFIMGHHPHTFQPFEKYNKGYIFYSLGTLTFGDYIREGKSEIQALFRKTKRSAIVKYDQVNDNLKILAIRELKGNIIVSQKRNYRRWSARKWLHYKTRNSNKVTNFLYDFNERVLYRIYEYFFGYYKNPIKRLFQFSNLRKVRKLFFMYL